MFLTLYQSSIVVRGVEIKIATCWSWMYSERFFGPLTFKIPTQIMGLEKEKCII